MAGKRESSLEGAKKKEGKPVVHLRDLVGGRSRRRGGRPLARLPWVAPRPAAPAGAAEKPQANESNRVGALGREGPFGQDSA